jgi:hypothetical protein
MFHKSGNVCVTSFRCRAPRSCAWLGVPDPGAPDSPAPRDPFPQIPAFEVRCIPAGFVTRPHRTAAGTLRPGASPDRAHRPSRCTASSGTDIWRPRGPLDYARDLAPARCLFRSTRSFPRPTGRLIDIPALPRVPGCPHSKPKERGISEVKRSRAGPPRGEPRTEPPSEAEERSPHASLWQRERKRRRASGRYDALFIRRRT